MSDIGSVLKESLINYKHTDYLHYAGKNMSNIKKRIHNTSFWQYQMETVKHLTTLYNTVKHCNIYYTPDTTKQFMLFLNIIKLF